MRRLALSCLTTVLLLPATAVAQERFEITPFAGYRFGGEIEAEDTDLFRHNVEVDEGASYGVTFGIPLTHSLQLELTADRQQSELQFDRGLFGQNDPIADVDVTYYHAGLLWSWGGGQVNPFFTISGGVTEIDIDLPRAGSEHRPSLGLGGGAKVFFSDHVGMRFEGRGYFTALEEDDDDDDRWWRDDEDDSEALVQGEARVGLIFAF